MLICLQTPLAPGADAWWRRPRALGAAAYALLRLGDPNLAQRLHEARQLRPFTVSALEGDEGVRLRLTGLTEAASAGILGGAQRWAEGEPLTFGEARLRYPAEDGDLRIVRTTYAELSELPFRAQMALQFRTPTLFKQAGGINLPLPAPELLVRSWARRWNAAAAELLRFPEALIGELAGSAMLAEAEIVTRRVRLAKGSLLGFVGRIQLRAHGARQWSAARRSAWAALIAYSRFCGTGARTAQGLGLTLPAAGENHHASPR